VWWFRANEYDAVDRAWRYAEQSDAPDRRLDGLWTHVIASRTQGRLRDALTAAREYSRFRRQTGNSDAVNGLLEAVVLAEIGRPRVAAVLYDSMARAQRGPSPSKFSATRAWYWTHEAGAAAAAGDTAMLGRLEDSVRVSGASATERYKRLHHYVRGLRLELAHRPEEAAAEFQQALWVRQSTHVRIYTGLARSLIEAGRPREAVAPLVEALKGPFRPPDCMQRARSFRNCSRWRTTGAISPTARSRSTGWCRVHGGMPTHSLTSAARSSRRESRR
jgi:tetratricopeptide (TPR) repeat protein